MSKKPPAQVKLDTLGTVPFVVAVARGATGAAPPFPPDTWRDPVVGVAEIVMGIPPVSGGSLGSGGMGLPAGAATGGLY